MVVALVVQVEEDGLLRLVVGLGRRQQVVGALRHDHLQALEALQHHVGIVDDHVVLGGAWVAIQ